MPFCHLLSLRPEHKTMQTRQKKTVLGCALGCWISSSKPVLSAAWSFITCFVGRREPFPYCRKMGLSNSFGGPKGQKLPLALSSNIVQNHTNVRCTRKIWVYAAPRAKQMAPKSFLSISRQAPDRAENTYSRLIVHISVCSINIFSVTLLVAKMERVSKPDFHSHLPPSPKSLPTLAI